MTSPAIISFVSNATYFLSKSLTYVIVLTKTNRPEYLFTDQPKLSIP